MRTTWSKAMLPAGLVLGAIAASAAQPEAPPAPTTLTVVNYQQQGSPPTGPFAVVIEHDPGLATHTIYRPQDLGKTKHGVVVWGEGACVKNGLSFPEYLSEIASYGFVIVADGPPMQRAGGPGAGGPGAGGPPQGAGGPPPGAGAPPAAGGPPPGGGLAMGNGGVALIDAIHWVEKASKDPKSRFYKKLDTKKIAAMGMSCGGLMSYGAAHDPHVSTVGIWNSGLFTPEERKQIFPTMHGTAIIITGGESDIAHNNGKADFETMPANIPVFYGVYPSVGHGGTYNQDNGGPFGKVAVAWLKWQLNGDKSAAGKGYFVGKDCTLCKDSNWQVQSRSLK